MTNPLPPGTDPRASALLDAHREEGASLADAGWHRGGEHLVRAVSWTGGSPHLDLVETATHTRMSVPLLGTRLAFTVRPDGRYCVGRFAFGRSGDGRYRPCRDRRLVTAGDQCETCGADDEFRFIHNAHRGGYLPDSLREYVAQPHWVYIATFADASCKVGTAAHSRKRARLDEQGAVRATYLAWAEDGLAARVYEDRLTEVLGVTQAKRRTAKVAALVRARSAARIEAAHAETVAAARECLAELSAVLPLEPWQPPAEHAEFFSAGAGEYPHTLASGPHCLTVRAMIGGAALVTVNDDDAPFIADLGALKGRRIVPGPVLSPETVTQLGLF